MADPTGSIDFFISYRGPRADWARWVNWVLRSEGYSTRLMDEFQVGTTWTNNMRLAAADCRRLIPLYSEDYWQSGACVEEFDAYWRHHLQDASVRFLLPLTVEKCTVPVIHGMLLSGRLYDLDHDAALAAIRKVLIGIVPFLPSPVPFTDLEPLYPGPASATAPVVATDWPDAVPALKWPLADHDDARLAFATLVTKGSSFRALLLKGASATGKSHLTRQLFANASRRVPGCLCGRFDFKGTGDLQAAVESFTGQLAVPVPAASLGLDRQFAAILQHLQQRLQPTLLVFDSYEMVGAVDKWFTESLLPSLHSRPWLRIVLAGQSVPARHGQSWDEDDAKVVLLTAPEPKHWFEWGVANGRPVTLDLAEKVHSLCNGQAAILASLFGPQ